MKDAFDRNEQITSRRAKIIASIERLSTVFRTTLQERSNELGLSPLQIQIILFVAYHERESCSVSAMAQEFAVKKPTISDAVRVLLEKKLLVKKQNTADARAFTVQLSAKGKKLIGSLSGLTSFFLASMESMEEEEITCVWNGILVLMKHLQASNMIPVRMCYSCQHFGKDHEKGSPHYCNLMSGPLTLNDIRIDCAEHVLA
jgi:DNA-binding MarR family transcriptional regulator